MAKTISQKIEHLSAKEKKEFKRLYKYIKEVSTVNWDVEIISNKQFNEIMKLLNKSIIGEDISFEVGYKFFRGNKLFVTKGVFVPQYDTEQIIEFLSLGGMRKTLLEVGTGTGAIAIAADKEYEYDVTAIDINKKAIKLASKNARENNAHVDFKLQDIFTFEPKEKFDILVSNPPYIKVSDPNVEKWVMENQPHNALYADEDGFAFYQRLILNHDLYINENGIMIFEIGYDQGEQIKNLAKQVKAKSVNIYKDIENIHDRFVVIEF